MQLRPTHGLQYRRSDKRWSSCAWTCAEFSSSRREVLWLAYEFWSFQFEAPRSSLDPCWLILPAGLSSWSGPSTCVNNQVVLSDCCSCAWFLRSKDSRLFWSACLVWSWTLFAVASVFVTSAHSVSKPDLPRTLFASWSSPPGLLNLHDSMSPITGQVSSAVALSNCSC